MESAEMLSTQKIELKSDGLAEWLNENDPV